MPLFWFVYFFIIDGISIYKYFNIRTITRNMDVIVAYSHTQTITFEELRKIWIGNAEGGETENREFEKRRRKGSI